MSSGELEQSLYSTNWSDNVKIQPLYVAEAADAAIQPGYVAAGPGAWTPFSGNYSYAKGFRQGNHVRFYARCKWGGLSSGTNQTFVISLEPLITAGWFSSAFDLEVSEARVHDNGGAGMQWLFQDNSSKNVEKSFTGFQMASRVTSTDPIHGIIATYYNPDTKASPTPVQGTYVCSDLKASTGSDYLSLIVDLYDQFSYS